MARNVNRQLQDAAGAGNLKQVRALIAEGANVNAASRGDGHTALMLALLEGHEKVWRHLLDAGARVDVKNEMGETALHLAAGHGNIEAMEALCERGVSIDDKERFGKTPLMEAATEASTKAVEWLLEHGADPNVADKDGCTALHWAYVGILMSEGEFDEECRRTIALLEKHGADPNIEDGLGRRPRDMIHQKGKGSRGRANRATQAVGGLKATSPADRALVEALENVGIQVGPPRKTGNAYFDELKCGMPKRLAEQVTGCEKEFATLGDDCRREDCIEKAFCWQVHVSTCAGMLDWWHFGFRGKLTPRQIAEKGVEIALTYFGVVGERLAKARPKMHWTKEVAWFEPYSHALLMSTLAGRTHERTRMSDSLHSNLAVETVAIPIEPALGDVLLCVAAPFRSQPMDTAPLQERLQKCRKQRPKLLLKAWQALETGDRPRFAAALADSTANFAKTTADDDRPSTAIALQESILAAVAYERGWTDLSFDLPLAARLVTHQSLEMD